MGAGYGVIFRHVIWPRITLRPPSHQNYRNIVMGVDLRVIWAADFDNVISIRSAAPPTGQGSPTSRHAVTPKFYENDRYIVKGVNYRLFGPLISIMPLVKIDTHDGISVVFYKFGVSAVGG